MADSCGQCHDAARRVAPSPISGESRVVANRCASSWLLLIGGAARWPMNLADRGNGGRDRHARPHLTLSTGSPRYPCLNGENRAPSLGKSLHYLAQPSSKSGAQQRRIAGHRVHHPLHAGCHHHRLALPRRRGRGIGTNLTAFTTGALPPDTPGLCPAIRRGPLRHLRGLGAWWTSPRR